MNSEAIKEVLDALFSQLERLDTQNSAMLQFLQEKKRVTDKQLAPYLEQAGNASSVRWRAARVRIDYLLSSAQTEEQPEKKPEAAAEKGAEKERAKSSGGVQAAKPEGGAANTTSANGSSVNAPAPKTEPATAAEKKQDTTDSKQAVHDESQRSLNQKPKYPKDQSARNHDAKPPDSDQPTEVRSESAEHGSAELEHASSSENKAGDPKAA
ncbi:MAG: hypothetical protein WA738_20000 [Candidatus Angelobacter sp.]